MSRAHAVGDQAGPFQTIPSIRASGEYTPVSLLIPLVMDWIQVGLMRKEIK